jgi:hypothetical protein
MAFKDLKKSKQGTFGKRNHITLMIPQKVEIIRKLKEAKTEVWLWLHKTLDYQLLYKDTEGAVIICGIK